jgi:hypothetical protein
MDDLEFRNEIMGFIIYNLRLAYGDVPENIVDAVYDLDESLCKRLGLDTNNIPDFD